MLQLAGILVLGVFAQWLAWRIKQPAILPLILIGLGVGPLSTLFTLSGDKLLDGDAIFTGDLLFSFVSLSVGVILFEGGLTLRFKELKSQGGTIRNLLLMGMIGTFTLGALTAHHIMDMGWRMSFLFGALIIVTGPTVVLPILRNVKPNHAINTVLKWEGILIDPFGALVAVLVYEAIKAGQPGDAYTLEMLKDFFITISAGMVSGGLSAFILYYLLKRGLLPSYLRNVFTLGLVILTFSFSELMHKEAGLMATTVMGIALANTKLDELRKILSFKEDLVLILVSVLFILLSSRIDMDEISRLGWPSIALFVVVVFAIRPFCVFVGTIGSGLSFREKLFISWIGPRGIVAAAVASFFSLQLSTALPANSPELAEANMLLPLTFLIIVGTVILQGSTAKIVARGLKVQQQTPKGLLMVGASEMCRALALKLKEEGAYIVLADTSPTHISDAKAMGLHTFEGSVLTDSIFEELDLGNIGKLLACTSNSGINMSVCRWFERELGEANIFRLVNKQELQQKEGNLAACVWTGTRADFVVLTQGIREKGLYVKAIPNNGEYHKLLADEMASCVPLFQLKKDGGVEIIGANTSAWDKGDRLIYALIGAFK